MSCRTATSWSWCRWLVGDNAKILDRIEVRAAQVLRVFAGGDSRALRLLLPLIYFTYYIKERSICYD